MRPALLSLFLLSLAVPLSARAEPKSWPGKMQQLASITNELLPELVSRKPDRQRVLKQAKALAGLAHALSDDAAKTMLRPAGDADASLPLIAGQFAVDAQYAYRAVKSGHTEYGLNLLRSLTGYCIACHTRHDGGPSFPSFPLSPKAASLTRGERADLFAATRQFDKAFAEYRAIVADGAMARDQQIEWQRAVRHGLALAVRVKKSPELASQIVDKVVDQAAAPEFLKRSAAKWKTALAKWKAEPAGGTVEEAALYAEMNRLLKDAQSSQEFPADNGANVAYLRASAAAHDLLARFPDSARAAEALFVAGISYDVIGGPAVWASHELYYEACIRRAAHTELAERCFDRFEQSIYFGYSGSGGTFIPEDVATKLRELRKLALVPSPPVP